MSNVNNQLHTSEYLQGNEALIPLGFIEPCEGLRQQIPVINQAIPNFLPMVKNIIVFSSGKGGVGKSTVCVEVAKQLAQAGARVGVLDADIYGPSIPTLLECEGEQANSNEQMIEPLFKQGLYVTSIGFLVPPENALAWRGPMATGALLKLVQQTRWPELDYLLIDMPPGTGDIQLTLAQKLPVTSAVVITTPHQLAIADARKGINLFNKVDVPILGIVENMTAVQCPHCGEESALFGTGAGHQLATETGVPLLGQIPIQTAVISGNSELETSQFKCLAKSIAVELVAQGHQLQDATPEIEL